ncbi:GNAT family N-acetyltransferase [Enterococcus gilvus]|uniref:GNAT family N-acetyltransferase n=1 Tax=Enterococcus gilvus TaxID=160453 RepID=UPI00290AA29B|nr:GNAT family N-acetyltransferase [Enterococcus gilvus]MDU5512085.1 GNAT family N-acetyltransferase [Enterococcus gilvus]
MIRFAKKEDGTAVAKLILVILKDMELDFLEEFGEEKALEVVAACFEDPTYRFGYARGLVEEIDGEIAGAVFGYPARKEPIIDLPLKDYLRSQGITEDIQMFIDPEAFPNEWYLDSIAVDEKFRGQGIGSKLLTAVDRLATHEGEKIIGLNVDQSNPNAKRLYLRDGFKDVGEVMISGHRYDHMQRKVKAFDRG